MNSRQNRSVTLLELLIAITLLSVIVLAFSSIELFSRHHVLTSERRATLQNEVSYVLEHMSKGISRAIGNGLINSGSVIRRDAIAGDTAIWAYIDYDGNGQRSSSDRWIAYRFTGLAGSDAYQMQYCSYCTNPDPNPNLKCVICTPAWGTPSNSILTTKIFDFKPNYDNTTADGDPIDNYVDITITARWEPGQPVSVDNPQVTMTTRIKMPSVSAN